MNTVPSGRVWQAREQLVPTKFMRPAFTFPLAGSHLHRPRPQTPRWRAGVVLSLVLAVALLAGSLPAGGVIAQENEAPRGWVGSEDGELGPPVPPEHPLKPGDALRAAQNRLLDRLWQMPFYLVAARPSASVSAGTVNPATDRALARSGYGSWRENIVATVFWVGEAAGPHNPVPNDASAWDQQWLKTFGGIDNPRNRTGVFPARFLPRRNPFYVALPFNDLLDLPNRPPLARLIPWAAQGPPHLGSESLCHGAWIAVRNATGKVCYAQWEDVGPFEVNHWQYVFGGDRPRPNRNGGAGIDLSPAVRDYLQLHGLDVVDWRFVRKEDVPPGPWLYYGRNGDKLDARLVVNALRTLVGNE